jgi:hypothetical protein
VYGRSFVRGQRWLTSGTAGAVEEGSVLGAGFVQK